MAGEPRAQPLSTLAQSGIGVTASPAGGAGLALDAAGKIPFSALPFNAIAYGSSLLSFATSVTSGTVAFSNLLALRQPNGTLLTPQSVIAVAGQGGGRTDIGISIVSVSAGGATFQGYVAGGVAITAIVTFWYLLLA